MSDGFVYKRRYNLNYIPMMNYCYSSNQIIQSLHLVLIFYFLKVGLVLPLSSAGSASPMLIAKRPLLKKTLTVVDTL